jgi:hypothetical protein
MKLYIKYDGIVACGGYLEQLERLNIKIPDVRTGWNRNKW